MTDYNDIDQQFRDHGRDWEGRPSDAAWNNLGEKLDAHRSARIRRQRTIYRWSAAASVAALMTLSVYMFNNSFRASGFQAVHNKTEVPEPDSRDRQIYQAQDIRGEENQAFAAKPAATTGDGAAAEEFKAGDADRMMAGPTAEAAALPAEMDSGADGFTGEEDPGDSPGAAAESAVAKAGAEARETPSVSDSAMDAGDEKPAADAVHMATEAIDDAVAVTMQGPEAAGTRQGKREKENRDTETAQAAALPGGATGSISGEVSAGAFLSATVIVLIPTETKDHCRFVAFEVEGDSVFYDLCLAAGSAASRSVSLSLDTCPVLARLVAIDRDHLRFMEEMTRSGPCLSSANSVVITYRTVTGASYTDETISFPLQEFCLPEEARPLVRDLKTLRDQYMD